MENKLRKCFASQHFFRSLSVHVFRCISLISCSVNTLHETWTRESLVKALNIYACYTALNYVAPGPNVCYAALVWEMDRGLQGFSLENLFFLQLSNTDL